MTTEENNKLIAEFMGLTEPFELPQFGTIRPNGDFKTEFLAHQLRYHNSWDWLMPVVEKISDMKSWSINATLDWLSESQERDGLYNLSDINKSAVQFINQHNKTK